MGGDLLPGAAGDLRPLLRPQQSCIGRFNPENQLVALARKLAPARFSQGCRRRPRLTQTETGKDRLAHRQTQIRIVQRPQLDPAGRKKLLEKRGIEIQFRHCALPPVAPAEIESGQPRRFRLDDIGGGDPRVAFSRFQARVAGEGDAHTFRQALLSRRRPGKRKKEGDKDGETHDNS